LVPVTRAAFQISLWLSTISSQMAEGLGFDSLWASDHVVFPRTGSAAHPSTVDHPVLTSDVAWLEAITLLSFVAACTTRPLLGTSVLVLPQRNPVLVAKQLASLDVLSGGRLVFGAGIGWGSEEFEALSTPFSNRGRRMDEYLEVIRQCWMEAHPGFQGRYYQLGDVGFYPKPARTSSAAWARPSADSAARTASTIT